MFTQMPNFAEGGFDFLRKLWGGGFAGMAGGMPNMASFAAPPMDLEEIDKRIHDLRAVESWLQLNASLLRTAIQGLEVQRATLVALQTFGSALSPDAMKSAFDSLTPDATSPDEESKPAWPHTAATAKPAEDEPPPEDEAEAEEDTDDDQAEARAENAQAQAHAAAQAQAAARAAAAALDPSPWWNMLQQQFNQIASSAAAAMPMPQNLMPGFPGGFPGFAGAPGAEGLDTAPEDIEEKTAPAKPKRAAAKPAQKPAAKTPVGNPGKPATKKAAAKKAPAKSAPRKPTNDTP
ncbi:PhaM family polyhydroxyalkanoate granule multifunctional regulatory protein [Ralstonia mojiangensis]|uniref:Transcriptional regulator n=1 Tax=Ralstonia mojiangensis TaxID=2953895 RepID=A0AAE3HZR1_9RALS|nr:PhaM family polyhydroxyalkanoate granule multifunctional regulatory protein [Ralstonia mojiangensis]MCO5411761.1 transcriptional regulator [Ralstonia mojiangensis]MCT7314710.1 transcriptional regulator [Ralstonia mojiangensis]MCT7326430.1 transcriptional regulator [Ralstonia mojiangensis]